MNGESAFGWLKVVLALAVFAAIAYAVYLLAKYIKSKGGVGDAALAGAQTLKDSTPLGIPARGIDAGISMATGRDETLGGLLAEWFNPTTKAANAMLQMNRVTKPMGAASVGGSADPFVGDLDSGNVELPNPRNAR